LHATLQPLLSSILQHKQSNKFCREISSREIYVSRGSLLGCYAVSESTQVVMYQNEQNVKKA